MHLAHGGLASCPRRRTPPPPPLQDTLSSVAPVFPICHLKLIQGNQGILEWTLNFLYISHADMKCIGSTNWGPTLGSNPMLLEGSWSSKPAESDLKARDAHFPASCSSFLWASYHRRMQDSCIQPAVVPHSPQMGLIRAS